MAPFSAAEDLLTVHLKAQGWTWAKIGRVVSSHSAGSTQAHFSKSGLKSQVASLKRAGGPFITTLAEAVRLTSLGSGPTAGNGPSGGPSVVAGPSSLAAGSAPVPALPAPSSSLLAAGPSSAPGPAFSSAAPAATTSASTAPVVILRANPRTGDPTAAAPSVAASAVPAVPSSGALAVPKQSARDRRVTKRAARAAKSAPTLPSSAAALSNDGQGSRAPASAAPVPPARSTRAARPRGGAGNRGGARQGRGRVVPDLGRARSDSPPIIGEDDGFPPPRGESPPIISEDIGFPEPGQWGPGWPMSF
ncbi:hypothetical protein K402DRAFT_418533 [Aulographum hederae CBS 113979]|uniref:Myb-like domain-containing protein n=1 Tax=Aulographum hederae CBS 113979 TaxID=1176131 RepID=A0A6G1H9C8_9PEZI|nr:hypothetical protein K402DRAFT_418533 [Aulographum hederae CBS 113979]